MKKRMKLLIAFSLTWPVLAQAQIAPPAAADESAAAGITSQGVPEPGRELSSGGANATLSEAGVDTVTLPSPTDRLKPVVTKDITYLCGGVGEEETSFMKQEAKGYDLMLTFAARDGAYLADVNVTISDPKGNTVLQTSCDSPILLVDLPRSGHYQVVAEATGYALKREVKVVAKGRNGPHLSQALLVWPQQVAEVQAAPESSSGAGSGQGSAGTGVR